jgi:hypothetical protein
MICMLFTLSAHSDVLTLHFEDIEKLLASGSPKAESVETEFLLFGAQRNLETQWSNPTLSFDLEDSESASEWQVTLGKHFTRPFSQSDLRNGWRDRMQSAELTRSRDSQVLLSEMQEGYIRLRLLDEHLDKLSDLKDLISTASSAASSMQEEGVLSGNSEALIQLTAFTLDSEFRDVQGKRQRSDAVWRSVMGIETDLSLVLATPIKFEPVKLSPADEYLANLLDHPRLQAQALNARGLTRLAEAHGNTLLADIELYAGYKQFEGDVSGLVAGVSFALPTFHQYASEGRIYEAQGRLLENELAILQIRMKEEIGSLTFLIENAQPTLLDMSSRFDSDPPLAESLFYSYREGSISMDTFLNGIQILASSMEAYYRDLEEYYMNILRLESITGTELIPVTS